MYEILYMPKVGKRDVPALSSDMKLRIQSMIELKLKENPSLYGKPLRANLTGYYSLRVGDYRIIYEIRESLKQVLIIAIKHRNKVYD